MIQPVIQCEIVFCVLIAFLKLRERRVVLKYLAKLTEKIESCTAEQQEVPDWCSKVKASHTTVFFNCGSVMEPKGSMLSKCSTELNQEMGTK